MSRKNILDQYYTRPSVARDLIKVFKSLINKDARRLVIEPSAGSGAFMVGFRNMLAYDLDPKRDDIEKKNFFELDPAAVSNILPRYRVAILGNPPFGFAGSLAIKFINHSAKFANTVAFVLPASFKKESTQAKVDRNLHLIHTQDLPDNSFLLEGQSYDVPCVFQIWKWKKEYREISSIDFKNNPYVEFISYEAAQVTPESFCVRRAGGKAGKVLDGVKHTKSSTYFLRPKVDNIKDIISSIDFSDVVGNTAGVKSLSKKELIMGVSDVYNNR